MKKLIVDFRYFGKAPNNCYSILVLFCNYTYLKNLIKLRLHCLIKIFVVV
jgi:hypothetical protein